MPEQRTVVTITTTVDRAHEARELLKTLRGQLAFQRRGPGTVENLRPPADPSTPMYLTVYLNGDVQDEVESRLAAMNTTFHTTVEVWEELNF
ncbi:MAG: hypothetical protein HOV92_17900 [Streptomyces sp.]|nr:hypothetical protein [Streptomyces sp.]